MSRAFTKESDDAGTELPDRALSEYPNYVTPYGLQQLKAQLDAAEKERSLLLANQEDILDLDPLAKQKIAMLERDMRYLSARQVSAIVTNSASQSTELVLFGATVSVEDGEGNQHEFSIVGEDEANIAANKVSWISPLAKALIGHKIGESVIWQRPAGNLNLEIVAIHY